MNIFADGLDRVAVRELIRAALAEDLAGGIDVTSVATVPKDLQGVGLIVAREAGTLAGVAVADLVFEECGLITRQLAADGAKVSSGLAVLEVRGPVRAILTAERTALNLLCHLSGIATLTALWVDAIAGTKAVIRDTRKTTPGLRVLEKYAVRCGGGHNHRMSLSDAALVKDNHVIAAGGVAEAFRAVRAAYPDLELEIECDTLEQVKEAVEAGADLILLDNMNLADLRASVAATAGRARLEASGGLDLGSAAAVAATGVDYLSVGALTHSAAVLDLGLDLELHRGPDDQPLATESATPLKGP